MAKKKKAKIDSKTQQAQIRNNYWKQLKVVYDKIHPELFPSFTQDMRMFLYWSRGTVISTRSEQNAPGWIREYCDDFIKDHMRVHYIEIIPGEFSLNMLDYSVYFLPFEACCRDMKHHGKEWFDRIVAKTEERMNEYESLMNAIAMSFMRNVSNQQYTMYSLSYTMFQDFRPDGEIRVNQHFKLKAYNPAEFVVWNDENDQSRVALEVVYNAHELFLDEGYKTLTPFKMLPSILGYKRKGEEKPVPVFILRHALNRMEERLECLVTGYCEAQIVPSLLKGNVCHTPNGALLVEYYIKKKKAGYLRVDVDENAILIRTFLFLTNASTPEGQKLRKHIGLRKDDVKFLNLDRLTPFMESDVLEDEEMCEIFRAAGCESLIELCERLKDSEFWNHSEEKKEMAAKLKKYMMLGEDCPS